MGIKKIELEVEYPDCAICGKDIGVEQYIQLEIEGSMFAYHREGRSASGASLKRKILLICKDCATNQVELKQRLQEEVEDILSEAQWMAT